MAVPKQKQSHSRTNKRRSTHKISSPTQSACPNCGAPRMPHRVCANCRTYEGREILAPESPFSTEKQRRGFALNANGADLGPEVVARGAELSGVEVEIFGPPMPGI